MRIGFASLLFAFLLTATRLAHAGPCDPDNPPDSVIRTTFAASLRSFTLGGGSARTTRNYSNNRVEFHTQDGELVGYWEIEDTTWNALYHDPVGAARMAQHVAEGDLDASTWYPFCTDPVECNFGPSVPATAAIVNRRLRVWMRDASRATTWNLARRCAERAFNGPGYYSVLFDAGEAHDVDERGNPLEGDFFWWAGFGGGTYHWPPDYRERFDPAYWLFLGNVLGSGCDAMPEFSQCMSEELLEAFPDAANDESENPSIEFPSGDPDDVEQASSRNEFVFPTTDPPNLQIQMESKDGSNKDALRWRVTGLPAGSFSWNPPAPGDATAGAGPSPTLTIPRLFARATDFGLKTVSLYDADGQLADTAEFELFWPIFQSYQAYPTLGRRS